MRKAIVCGAGGFIGSHLVKRLKSEGYWVRGVDLKMPEWSPTVANDFIIADLRDPRETARAFDMGGDRLDEVYQLAADMGGMGFIESHEADIMRNNALININCLHQASQTRYVERYFFSSSACVYRDSKKAKKPLVEDDAYPAAPDNEYGWEKLYAERMAEVYQNQEWPLAPGFQVRIARFGNTYGPEGTWTGGREKAPAALCRKVAEAEEDGEIEVWGDGRAVRSYLYIDDLIDGIRAFMDMNLVICDGPLNLGSDELATVDGLAALIMNVAGKSLGIKHVDGPVGVDDRRIDHSDAKELINWQPKHNLEAGLSILYPWVKEQVDKSRTLVYNSIR